MSKDSKPSVVDQLCANILSLYVCDNGFFTYKELAVCGNDAADCPDWLMDCNEDLGFDCRLMVGGRTQSLASS
jgi:hypothetical protein